MSNHHKEIIQSCINKIVDNDLPLNNLANYLNEISLTADRINDNLFKLNSSIEKINQCLDETINNEKRIEILEFVKCDLEILQNRLNSIRNESRLNFDASRLINEILGRNHIAFLDLEKVLEK